MAVTNEVVHLCGRFKHFLCLFGIVKEMETTVFLHSPERAHARARPIPKCTNILLHFSTSTSFKSWKRTQKTNGELG